jgi:Niemann-Pick C1 protein
MRQLSLVAALVGLSSLALQPTLAVAQGETKIHEKGRCAIRGQCGKQSIFGGELPCPDNGRAKDLEDSARQKLVNLCGPKWESGPVCCLEEQVSRNL